jgi:hypothetical protein
MRVYVVCTSDVVTHPAQRQSVESRVDVAPPAVAVAPQWMGADGMPRRQVRGEAGVGCVCTRRVLVCIMHVRVC